ncbi:carboxylesterase [Verticiella sediminum]|uniref:Carboxylesterase n=1 Tax=Verticiella sediminum TaxID=1247510 RepID=A0A556A7N8_9BURK|nr:alpha/beta hydrolase [Verticiella sediminum]TSH88880.1 carboxylesterase [Verticiella sediminum]
MTAPSLLEAIEIQTGPNPQRAVIWLHGLGADGRDFAPIVPELDLAGVPDVRFVFPHAPVMPVTINGGMAMRAWYDIVGSDLVRREDADGILASQAAVEALLAREQERGIDAGHIVLAGFSQGCAMTLQTGLRYGKTLAGLVALSGYLPLADTLAAEASPANKATPIFMAHGIHDPVVALERAESSRAALERLGYAVEWHTYPMPHSVHPQEIQDLGSFLRRVLA